MIKYYPEDDSFGYIGIKFPANGTTAGSNGGFFNMSRTTEEQAVTNYINLLLTKRGERYMQPSYGIGIQYRLFEPNTESLRDDIEFEISQQSSIWLPYIRNHSIEVRGRVDIPGITGTDAENAIQIVITFSVLESPANRTITIFQDNGKLQYLVN